MKFPVIAIGVTLALALIGGCGQKGPLYLPQKNGTVVTRPAASVPPPAGASEQINPPPQQSEKKDDDTSSRPK
jgi:predicted small lipoprotein YifL